MCKFLSTLVLLALLCVHSIRVKAQWVLVNNGLGNIGVPSLTYSGNNIFAGTVSPNIGVFISTNSGANWTQTSFNNRGVISLSANGNNIFAGTGAVGVYSSTNSGTTWVQTPLNNLRILSLACSGSNTLAGTFGSGVYLSTDNGATWAQTSASGYAYSLTVSGNNVFAGFLSSGAYLSTDNGATWAQTSLNNQSVQSLATNGNNIFAGTFSPNNGVFLSTDNGTTWSQTSLNNQNVLSLAVSGSNVFAGTKGSGVYLSTDNGATWIQWNQGLADLGVYALCIFDNYIFAGTLDGSGAYRRSLGELTSIKQESNEHPGSFKLYQNYPNPFNPKTNIVYRIVSREFVVLAVFDLLGRKIATLVSEVKEPGNYEVTWDASELASGVYLYRITAGAFTETKKLVLMR